MYIFFNFLGNGFVLAQFSRHFLCSFSLSRLPFYFSSQFFAIYRTIRSVLISSKLLLLFLKRFTSLSLHKLSATFRQRQSYHMSSLDFIYFFQIFSSSDWLPRRKLSLAYSSLFTELSPDHWKPYPGSDSSARLFDF